jgi:hypothetical protein
MKKSLWQPSEERKNQANVTRFIGFVNGKYGLDIGSYAQLYDWSIKTYRISGRPCGNLGRSKLPEAILRWLIT